MLKYGAIVAFLLIAAAAALVVRRRQAARGRNIQEAIGLAI
jgi:hypothetical protein